MVASLPLRRSLKPRNSLFLTKYIVIIGGPQESCHPWNPLSAVVVALRATDPVGSAEHFAYSGKNTVHPYRITTSQIASIMHTNWPSQSESDWSDPLNPDQEHLLDPGVYMVSKRIHVHFAGVLADVSLKRTGQRNVLPRCSTDVILSLRRPRRKECRLTHAGYLSIFSVLPVGHRAFFIPKIGSANSS